MGRIVLPDLLRRVAALTVLSAVGIALIAPLTARSALPEVAADVEPLLVGLAEPAVAVERGFLADRALHGAIATITSATSETLRAAPLPTPASAPMEATLYNIATAKLAPAAPAPQGVVTSDGDTVWDDLAQCESGGNWAINTGNGYYGGLQFSLGTWQGYGGGEFAAYAHEASREQQIGVAERLHAARGYAPWPACRAELGLP